MNNFNGIASAALCLIVLFGFVSCGDAEKDGDDLSASGSNPDASDDDASSDDEASDDDADHYWPITVIDEWIEIDGEPAPPNPETGDATPEVFNKIRFHRIRESVGREPRSVSAILILLPGYTVGTGYMTFMAENLVKMAAGDIEVWLPERRHNMLEDEWGMIAAETMQDPRIAIDYYFKGKPVWGRTFAGFLKPESHTAGMMSEWGLDLDMKDIRRLIHLIPEESRRTGVFLGGHSRGVIYTRAYASQEFDDGTLGCDELAGLVLIDGDGRYQPWMSEGSYQKKLLDLRRGDVSRFVTLPPFGPPLYSFVQILAMATTEGFGDPNDPELGPDGVFHNLGPLAFLKPIALRLKPIRMNNEAFFGFMSDNDSGLVGIVRAGFGALDGPTAHDFLGDYPTDPDHFYRWKHYNETDPKEFCEIQDFLPTLYKGPSNGLDMYYSARLDLDFYAADQLETEGTWRDNYFKFCTSLMDAPVFALATRIMSPTDRYEDYRDRLPPVRNQERPRTEVGFEILRHPEWEHIDPLCTRPESNDFLVRLLEWMGEHSSGDVRVPKLLAR